MMECNYVVNKVSSENQLRISEKVSKHINQALVALENNQSITALLNLERALALDKSSLINVEIDLSMSITYSLIHVYNDQNNSGKILSEKLRDAGVAFQSHISLEKTTFYTNLISDETFHFPLEIGLYKIRQIKSNFLHLSSLLGCIELTKYLVLRGMNVNSVVDRGETPLLAASRNGHLNIVRCLLVYDATVDFIGGWNKTALLEASKNGHSKIVELLLLQGAEVDQIVGGNTALLVAVRNGHINAVKVLVESGSDVNYAGTGWLTALMIASQENRSEIVRYLLENGADVNQLAALNLSSLIFACIDGHLEIVKCLVEHGADINHTCALGLTSLTRAAINHNGEIVSYLLFKGAKITDQQLSRMNDGAQCLVEQAQQKLRDKSSEQVIAAVSLFAQRGDEQNSNNDVLTTFQGNRGK